MNALFGFEELIARLRDVGKTNQQGRPETKVTRGFLDERDTREKFTGSRLVRKAGTSTCGMDDMQCGESSKILGITNE